MSLTTDGGGGIIFSGCVFLHLLTKLCDMISVFGGISMKLAANSVRMGNTEKFSKVTVQRSLGVWCDFCKCDISVLTGEF